MQLNKQELTSIVNLLYTGKWNFSRQESDQNINPLINKLSKMVDELNKPKEQNDKEEVKEKTSKKSA